MPRTVVDINPELVVDEHSFFEIAPGYGKARVTGLARVAGCPVGVMANNPMYGGATGIAEGEKAIRLISLCDTFHLPLVSFADEPGFMVGIEKRGIERAGARLVCAVCERVLATQVGPPAKPYLP